MLRTSSPILKPIREKVEAGERLSLDDGLVLERPDVPLPEVGELANLVRERKNGNCAYYNINTHLNPTNVCVYRCVFCAFRSDLRDPKGYVMSDEQILARGRGGGRQRLHRDAHRRRPAPPEEVRLVPQHHPHAARGVSRAAPEGLDAGRDRLVLPAGEQERPRGSGRHDRRRPRQPARRRGGDFSSRGPQPDLRAQGRRPPLVRHPSHGPRTRPALELHDALRPHRAAVPPHRPPDSPPRAAGRNRRLPDVHPAGVPPGQHGPLAHQEAVEPDGPAR